MNQDVCSNRVSLRWRLSAVILLIAATADPAQLASAAEGYFPPGDPRAGGIRDLMLIYLGQGKWNTDEFLPYVAYLGQDVGKQPLDWFYDSYLFLAYGGAPSGTTYYDGPTNKADWEHYFNLLLPALQNLQACIRSVEHTLGPCPQKVPIIVMIPFPSPEQHDFGDVDGDGTSEDLVRAEDRQKTVAWCVEEVLRRWRETDLSGLQLWGFYWMNESTGPQDAPIIRFAANYVHQRHYGLHWIPYFSAGGVDDAYDLGFDFIIYQPNYAFMEEHGLRLDEQRLNDASVRARQLGFGIEIEMQGRVSSVEDRRNLLAYLAYGRDDMQGYMRQAVHGYYQGIDAIARLCHSDVPAERALYDALYEFAKGRFQGQRWRPLPDLPYEIDGAMAAGYQDDGKKLTDGRWATSPEELVRAVGLSSEKNTVRIDLGGPRRIAGLRLRVATPDNREAALPRTIRIESSGDGDRWDQVRHSSPMWESPNHFQTAVWLVQAFQPHDARHVRVSLEQTPGQTTFLDEIMVEPAPSLATEGRFAFSPLPREPRSAASLLADGQWAAAAAEHAASAVWAAGEVANIVLELPHARHAGLVRLHAVASGEGQGPALREVRLLTRADESEGWTDAGTVRPLEEQSLLNFPLDTRRPPVRQFQLIVTPEPDRAIALDELEIFAATNLALCKPYRVSPRFRATYDDDQDQELADGKLTVDGFPDGRTVGWYNTPVAVSVDLGAEALVDQIRVHVQGGGYAAVNFPRHIDVWTSTTGDAWTRADTISEPPQILTLDRVAGEGRSQLGWMGKTMGPVAARYVRLDFVEPRGWTMISELEILSGDKNMSLGQPYHLHPSPTSTDRYADSGSKLTDGIYVTTGNVPQRGVKWQEGTPSVVIDLQTPQEITTVAAHVLGQGARGIHYPERMRVSLSLDGDNWQQAATVVGTPSPGDTATEAYVTAQFDASACRFVKLDFERRDGLLIDEIEILGPPIPPPASR